MTDSAVLTAWRTGNMAELSTLARADLVFSSPVADYRGHAAAMHILGLIAQIVADPEVTDEWIDEWRSCRRFDAHVAGEQVQGVLHEECDRDNRLVHVTLFLRPLETLHKAIAAMKVLLDSSPLPDRAG